MYKIQSRHHNLPYEIGRLDSAEISHGRADSGTEMEATELTHLRFRTQNYSETCADEITIQYTIVDTIPLFQGD